MRKDIQRKRNIQKASLNKMLFTSGGIVSLLIIVVVVSFFIYGNKNAEESKLGQINNDKIASLATEGSNIASQTSSSIGKSVNEAKEESNTVVVVDTSSEKSKNEGNQIKNNKETSENKSNKTSNTTIKEESKSVNTEENVAKKETKKSDPVFSMPVEGDVITEYAKDKLVYSDTLKEWVTHAGIDIKADKTTIVKASEEGKIKSIKNDPRYGLTVVIEHNNGYSTVYSNLLTAEFVTAGENVKKGQTIGTVGNTATFEISDESHLHFEILKDNVQIDPNMYIK
ncbi:metalloendopeptidase-like membrane protein [Clostridium sp. CAG:571]|jgi:murein DD-endopeptidase MepM/ murein hydrolase activator NlpD|nr:metalloendopeptidase-like membrane protein [Clostridium sp. CAG:571]HJJ06173.1 M23 family metallopeptidase [Clostridiaceae bacterium]